MMHPVPNESSPAAANNPAGRVREFLLEFEATMRTVEDNAMLVLMKMLDEPQESTRIYHSMTELRMQAEAVQRLMAQHEGSPASPATSTTTPRSWRRPSSSTCRTSTGRPKSLRSWTTVVGPRCGSRARC